MTVNTTLWDPAEHLDTPEVIAAYLEAASADGDPALIAAALDDVARAIAARAKGQLPGLETA